MPSDPPVAPPSPPAEPTPQRAPTPQVEPTPQAEATPSPPGRMRVLSCPNCGGTVMLRAGGISITAVCASCGGVLDVATPEVKLIAEAEARTVKPRIPIGSRGTLAGAEWQVVGFQTRSDIANGWFWHEYLLFNPYLGFRFLSEDEETWTFYCMLREAVTDPAAGYGGRRYSLSSQGTARTDYVMGEFYWRVRAGDQSLIAEYEDDDFVLSQDRSGREIVWSRGVRIPNATIEAAFGLAHETVAGRAAPSASGGHRRATLTVGLWSILLLILMHMMPFGSAHDTVVFSRAFHTTAADKGHVLVSDPFEIPGSGGNLRLSANSQVSNNWVELGITLVGPNDQTFEATPSIEYYSGYDEDGSWTEGSRDASVRFASVPGGTWRLLIEPYAGVYDQSGANPVDFTVTLTRHVASWWLFWVALLVLLPWPLWQFFFGRDTAYSPPRARIP